MKRRPRVAVVGYGSMLDKGDLRELFIDGERRSVPVKVDGFERIFNQEATWRDVDGNERAVLNVVRSDDSWFNGVLVPDLDRQELSKFRRRERGYRLVAVELDQIEPYSGPDRARIDGNDLVLTTTGEKVQDDIAPIRSYARLCVEGAADWGDEFLSDFLATTGVSEGRTLDGYLEREPSGA